MKSKIARRTFVAGAAAFAGALAFPLSAPARMPLTKAQVPGYFRRKLGAFEVTAILDGDLTLEPKLFSGDAKEMEAVAAKSFMTTPVRSHVNAFAINTGERLYLVDTGTGALMGPSLGRANANLVLAGIDPAQVDAILLTHIHPDHFGGMTVQGKPVFGSADVFVSEADARFWLSVESAAKAPAEFKPFFDMARAAMAPYANRIKPLPANGELGPGVEAISLPGHTLGHSGYIFTSGSERLLVWGDIVHNAALQFARPEWTIAFDTDQVQAAATRKRVFDMSATDRLLVAGMHLPFPGLGYVERTGSEYRFHPDFWRSSL